MGLLDQLWDDTVAGPRPDSGLGRLRKPPAVRVEVGDAANLTCCKGSGGGGVCSVDRDLMHPQVTRTIKIRRPPPVHGAEGATSATNSSSSSSSGGAATPPLSPATPPPSSPFAGEARGGGAGGIGWRFRFRKTAPAQPRDKATTTDRNDDGGD